MRGGVMPPTKVVINSPSSESSEPTNNGEADAAKRERDRDIPLAV